MSGPSLFFLPVTYYSVFGFWLQVCLTHSKVWVLSLPLHHGWGWKELFSAGPLKHGISLTDPPCFLNLWNIKKCFCSLSIFLEKNFIQSILIISPAPHDPSRLPIHPTLCPFLLFLKFRSKIYRAHKDLSSILKQTRQSINGQTKWVGSWQYRYMKKFYSTSHYENLNQTLH